MSTMSRRCPGDVPPTSMANEARRGTTPLKGGLSTTDSLGLFGEKQATARVTGHLGHPRDIAQVSRRGIKPNNGADLNYLGHRRDIWPDSAEMSRQDYNCRDRAVSVSRFATEVCA